MAAILAGKLVVLEDKRGKHLMIIHATKKGMSEPRAFDPKALDLELHRLTETDLLALNEIEVDLELYSGAPVKIRKRGTPWKETAGQAMKAKIVPHSSPTNPNTDHVPFPHLPEQYSGSLPGSPFVYPYNFVRIGNGSTVRREGPPSHDRFHADRVTGTIDISITPLSPWFLPESEPYEGKKGALGKEGHCKYSFSRDEQGCPKLHATSLKGMLRSTLEALTESCFSVFSWPKRSDQNGEIDPRSDADYLGMRYNPKRGKYSHEAQKFTPGRVEIGSDGRFVIRECKAWWMEMEDVDSSARPDPDEGEMVTFDEIKRPLRAAPWKGPFGRLTATGGKQGYLKPGWRLKSKTPGRHHYDRVFEPTDKTIVPTDADRDAYARLLNEQAALSEDEFSRGIDWIRPKAEAPSPKIGELVYFREYPRHLNSDPAHAFEIGRTAIPRISPRRSVLDLLPLPYRSCSDPAMLCPACRIFGMVSKHGTGAYCGNVRIGQPTWHGPADWAGPDVELRVLGTPHPESTNFYLVDRDQENRDEVSYDYPQAILRGRKRYWVREMVRASDYTMPPGHPYEGDNQSITAELLPPDIGYFTVTLHFENLQRWELGALLFALKLRWSGPQGVHQIGHGKPLGLGQCRIEVLPNLRVLLDPVSHYMDLSLDAGETVPLSDLKNNWIDEYIKQYTGWYGKLSTDFETIPPIKDLKTLTIPQPWAIRYPEFKATDKSEMGEKTFRWFCGDRIKEDAPNKQDRQHNVEHFPPGTRETRNRRDVPLPLPDEAEIRQYHGDEGK